MDTFLEFRGWLLVHNNLALLGIDQWKAEKHHANQTYTSNIFRSNHMRHLFLSEAIVRCLLWCRYPHDVCGHGHGNGSSVHLWKGGRKRDRFVFHGHPLPLAYGYASGHNADCQSGIPARFADGRIHNHYTPDFACVQMNSRSFRTQGHSERRFARDVERIAQGTSFQYLPSTSVPAAG